MLAVGLTARVGGAVALGRLCGLVAIWWPARRAAATDPASALKQG